MVYLKYTFVADRKTLEEKQTLWDELMERRRW